MENINFYKIFLLELKQKAGEIEAQWNGDKAGKQEDNYNIAREIIEKIDEIVALLDTLN